MSALTVADVLDKAADLLTPEGAWTQGAGARDVAGRELRDACEDQAVCWCIGGALFHVTGRPVPHTDAFVFLSHYLGQEPHRFNDAPGRQQSEVVAKLREAALRARAGGAA